MTQESGLTIPISQFDVLEQCYCMKDAPSEDYPENKGVCQYCRIKALLLAAMQENAMLRAALEKYVRDFPQHATWYGATEALHASEYPGNAEQPPARAEREV